MQWAGQRAGQAGWQAGSAARGAACLAKHTAGTHQGAQPLRHEVKGPATGAGKHSTRRMQARKASNRGAHLRAAAPHIVVHRLAAALAAAVGVAAAVHAVGVGTLQPEGRAGTALKPRRRQGNRRAGRASWQACKRSCDVFDLCPRLGLGRLLSQRQNALPRPAARPPHPQRTLMSGEQLVATPHRL